MNKDPRFKMFTQLMTTTTLGMALPAFKEDFGEGKPVDVVGTLSHDFISSTVDNVPLSGLSIDKNGNAKLAINLGA